MRPRSVSSTFRADRSAYRFAGPRSPRPIHRNASRLSRYIVPILLRLPALGLFTILLAISLAAIHMLGFPIH